MKIGRAQNSLMIVPSLGSLIVEVAAPRPPVALPSVPIVGAPAPPNSDVGMDYRGEPMKSTEAIVGAVQQDNLGAAKSLFSLKLWIERYLKRIWFGIAGVIVLWLTLRYFAGVFWLWRNGRPADEPVQRLVKETTSSLQLRRARTNSRSLASPSPARFSCKRPSKSPHCKRNQ
jgi:hypothetical protein